MPSSSQSPESQGKTKSKNFRTKIIAALVVLITAVTTTIYVWDHISKRESSTETLSINQKSGALEDTTESPTTTEPSNPDSTPEPAYTTIGDTYDPFKNTGPESDPVSWRIPITASIEDFPIQIEPSPGAEFESGCNEAELNWLRENAIPAGHPMDNGDPARTFNIAIRNEATSGGSLSLRNIRFEGSETHAAPPTIFFQCPILGNGALGSQELLINVTGEPAVYGEVLDFSANGKPQFPEGTPVTLNLEPGENLAIILTRDDAVDTQKQYEGRFLADVVGTDETVILADNVEFTRAVLPGYFIGFNGGAGRTTDFVCRDGEKWGSMSVHEYWKAHPRDLQDTYEPCTIKEAADLMRRAVEHVTQ